MTQGRTAFSIPNVLVPPDHMRDHKRDADYIASALHTVEMIAQFIAIQPHFKVLDVGCAAGRVALPLLEYLDPDIDGLYEGFDIREDSVQWATSWITPLFPHFRFRSLDVRNTYTNSDGSVDGSSVAFPYPDSHFDLIVFHSVFTHLVPQTAVNYLSQAARVLANTGRIYSTCYLWDAATAESVSTHPVLWSFPVDYGHYRTMEVERPDFAVAFEYEPLQRTVHDLGLRVETESRGSWRVSANHGQDILILAKEHGKDIGQRGPHPANRRR